MIKGCVFLSVATASTKKKSDGNLLGAAGKYGSCRHRTGEGGGGTVEREGMKVCEGWVPFTWMSQEVRINP